MRFLLTLWIGVDHFYEEKCLILLCEENDLSFGNWYALGKADKAEIWELKALMTQLLICQIAEYQVI